jgi:hypothetical protein
MISNPISKRISKLFGNTSFSAGFSQLKLAHTIGASPKNFIETSVAECFNQITEKYPDNVYINSYSQNISFTYQKTH